MREVSNIVTFGVNLTGSVSVVAVSSGTVTIKCISGVTEKREMTTCGWAIRAVMNLSLTSTVGIETTVMTTVSTIAFMRSSVLSVRSNSVGRTAIVMVAVDTGDADMAEGAPTMEAVKIDTKAEVTSCGDSCKSRSSSKSEHSL